MILVDDVPGPFTAVSMSGSVGCSGKLQSTMHLLHFPIYHSPSGLPLKTPTEGIFLEVILFRTLYLPAICRVESFTTRETRYGVGTLSLFLSR
jgi:hypothetical protein